MKKICLVINGFEQGGVSSSAMNFIRNVSLLGYHIDVVDMCGDTTLDYSNVRNLKIKGIAKYWNLDVDKLQKASFIAKPLLFLLSFVKKLTNRRGKWYPIIFRWCKLAGEYDAVFAYRQCAPCFYFALNCIHSECKVGLIHGDIEYMGDISSWSCMFPKFDKIACVSDAVAEGFRKRFPLLSNRFVTLYNMFDVDAIKTKAKEPLAFEINSSIPNIVTIARHDNGHKKVNRVAEVCKVLQNRGNTSFHWYVVGGGPDFEQNQRDAIELGLSGLITYCGAMSNPFAILAKCDFLVLPSLTESFGMVIIEAKILGKPSVASYFPSLPEVLHDGFDGIIAKQTVLDIADCVERLIENRGNLLSDMKEYIINHPYNQDIVIKQLETIIN